MSRDHTLNVQSTKPRDPHNAEESSRWQRVSQGLQPLAQVLAALLFTPTPLCAETCRARRAIAGLDLLGDAIHVEDKPVDAHNVAVTPDHEGLGLFLRVEVNGGSRVHQRVASLALVFLHTEDVLACTCARTRTVIPQAVS
jgi:hypothetical protein